ncbi:hypothetical protein ABZX93_21800 [Streptomyces sp. NPDC006632]|uniref:hypothetical protein n=1 Tax=unclassified Streptomyces TaxID=2593676 RepID=UPI002E1B2619
MKGDRVEMVVGAGYTTRTDEAVAGRAGRRVGTAVRRGVVEVSEVTHSGAVARTARLMATRAPALVGQPVPRGAAGESEPRARARPLREDPKAQGSRLHPGE